MKYTAEDLAKELHESYPNYSLEEFTEICLTPLTYFKKNMKDKSLPTMRLKYMGMFTVFPSVITKMMHYNRDRLSKGIITKDTFDTYNKEMEEIYEQLTTKPTRGTVNIIYHDEPLETLPE